MMILQHGMTALMMVSERGHKECAKVLLERGAEVNMQDKVSTAMYVYTPTFACIECTSIPGKMCSVGKSVQAQIHSFEINTETHFPFNTCTQPMLRK